MTFECVSEGGGERAARASDTNECGDPDESHRALSSGIDNLVDALSALKQIATNNVPVSQDNVACCFSNAANNADANANIESSPSKQVGSGRALVRHLSNSNVSINKEEGWQEVSMQDLKANQHLDALLVDSSGEEDQALHHSMPTMMQAKESALSHDQQDSKTIMGRRGSMIAEGVYRNANDVQGGSRYWVIHTHR